MIIKTSGVLPKKIKEYDDLRLVKKEQALRYGAGYFECRIPELPVFTDRVYRYKEYQVNLYHLTCTCESFKDKLLLQYPPRDIRRICIHIYNKLTVSAAGKGINQLTKLLLESAVKHNAGWFYRYYFRKEKREVFFAFTENNPWVNVFIQPVPGENSYYIRLGYNALQKRWNYGQVPADSAKLEYIIESISANQLPFKFY